MLVMKFGGTSVGSPQRMKEVLSILQRDNTSKIVVLSAMSGTTNELVHMNQLISTGETDQITEAILVLREKYNRVVIELLPPEFLNRGNAIIDNEFSKLSELANQAGNAEGEILALGELLSTHLFHLFCLSEDYPVELLTALDYMSLDHHGEPDLDKIERDLTSYLENKKSNTTYITQGYICRNPVGEITNLGRGGSDYTATIMGAVLNAHEVQIWTDIDGVHNNDPRVVEGTTPVRFLSYREAAELAYFGAKILHPTCVLPAEKRQVPVRLKYTMEPSAQGTLISSRSSSEPITAIAAKDNITAVKIYSHRMLMAYGFLRKVFQVFENYKTSVDMITTSEVAVSLTIDDDTHIEEIQKELSVLGDTAIAHNYSIICIVGSGLYDENQHLHSIFDALKGIPIRMTSMGGSKNNISLLVKTEFKKQALLDLNSILVSN